MAELLDGGTSTRVSGVDDRPRRYCVFCGAGGGAREEYVTVREEIRVWGDHTNR